MLSKKMMSFFKLAAFFALSFFIIYQVGYSQIGLKPGTALLQGFIHLHPLKPLPDAKEKIQPGTPVTVSVTLENKGEVETPAGELYVRYAFTKPLDDHPNSIIFETEKVPVVAIAPGKSVNVQFTTSQQLPSVFDFIRYDWAMREYQAFFVSDQTEKLIGRLAITFSAYYYPGLSHEIPVEIPVSMSQ